MKKQKRHVAQSRSLTAKRKPASAVADWDRLLSDVHGLELLAHLQLQLIRNLERTAESAKAGSGADNSG